MEASNMEEEANSCVRRRSEALSLQPKDLRYAENGKQTVKKKLETLPQTNGFAFICNGNMRKSKRMNVVKQNAKIH